jgi:hypothetical protein
MPATAQMLNATHEPALTVVSTFKHAPNSFLPRQYRLQDVCCSRGGQRLLQFYAAIFVRRVL